jgi:hypothetical protein
MKSFGSHPQTGPPRAQLLLCVAAGAALGVALREICSSMWTTPAQRWISMMLFAGFASFALGWMLAVETPLRLLAAIWGWSGALCSISVITTFALGAPAVWALCCMTLVPMSAATGVAVGAMVSVGRRQRRQTASEASPSTH